MEDGGTMKCVVCSVQDRVTREWEAVIEQLIDMNNEAEAMAVDSTVQFVMGDWELGKNFSRNGMC